MSQQFSKTLAIGQLAKLVLPAACAANLALAVSARRDRIALALALTAAALIALIYRRYPSETRGMRAARGAPIAHRSPARVS